MLNRRGQLIVTGPSCAGSPAEEQLDRIGDLIVFDLMPQIDIMREANG